MGFFELFLDLFELVLFFFEFSLSLFWIFFCSNFEVSGRAPSPAPRGARPAPLARFPLARPRLGPPGPLLDGAATHPVPDFSQPSWIPSEKP